VHILLELVKKFDFGFGFGSGLGGAQAECATKFVPT
jgi:hypothetical protein